MEITDTIRYVGVDDLDIDLFESQYVVPEGMSYNAYVIIDEKIALMDTCDQRKGAEWWYNVQTLLQGRTPSYLVVHHMEPDHAGEIARAMEAYPTLTLVASAKAIAMLPQFFEGHDWSSRTLAVKEGDTLCLGTHTLHFVAAPMVHWPEVMVSYESSEKVLFAADGFGKFGAIANETDDWACEARRYYFNIVGKYGAPVQTLLKKAATLDIKTICPLHGPVLTGDLTPYLSLYDTWSSYRPEKEGVFIACASIHGGTLKAAEVLADMLRQKGVLVELKDVCREDIHECVESAFEMSHTIFMASSYDGGVFTPMYNLLHLLEMKSWQKRTVGLVENGSWAPTAARTMRGVLEGMKDITIVDPVVTIKSRLHKADMPQLEALADAML